MSDDLGQYIAYTFFRVDPAWRRLPIEERTAAKDAFAEVLDDFAPRFDALRTYSTTGVRAETDFFLWKITSPLRRPGRARRCAQRHAARRLARDPVLVPGDDEGLRVHLRAPRPQDRAEGIAVPRRLSVREGAALVRASRERPAARDGRAHPHRARGVPDDPQPHDLLVRDRRPGVHDGVRMRRAVGLHAPDAAAARLRGLALHRARHADLRRPARRDPRSACAPRRARLHSSKTTVRRVTAPRSCSSSMRPVPPCDQANAAATWCSSFSWIPSSWIVSVGRLLGVGPPDRVQADERTGGNVLEMQFRALRRSATASAPSSRRRPQR